MDTEPDPFRVNRAFGKIKSRGVHTQHPANSKRAIIRIDSHTTSIPVRYTKQQSLIIYVRGNVLDCQILGGIINLSPHLIRVYIERRDNDWDAQDTAFRLVNDDCISEYLKDHPSLRDFSLSGVTTSVQLLCEALAALPQLDRVSIKADPSFAIPDLPEPLLKPVTLAKLLARCSKKLSLSGLFPETIEFTRPLHDSFVFDCNKLHIFVHFSGNSKVLSKFSYFLREVMELNQQGRREKNAGILIRHYARKRNSSLDVLYLVLRENPWLCETVDPSSRHVRGTTWKVRLRLALSRLQCTKNVP